MGRFSKIIIEITKIRDNKGERERGTISERERERERERDN